MFDILDEKVEMVKSSILNDLQLNSSPYAKMAIRDVALLLTYCY